MQSKIVQTSLCSILLLFGGYGGITSLSDITEVFEASSWPTTQGIIASSGYKTCGKNGHKYPSVEYKYTVNTITFSGNRINLSPTCSNAGQNLAHNDNVVIHYSPQNPAASVLYIDGHFFWHWFSLVASVTMIFVGLFGVLRTNRPNAFGSHNKGLDAARIKAENARMEGEIRERLSSKWRL